jgi:hypothetical protein
MPRGAHSRPSRLRRSHRSAAEIAEIDGATRAYTSRRWFGLGGLAVGGATSLAIGAVLGGALTGVPILLPPPEATSAVPQVTVGHGAEGAKGSTIQLSRFDLNGTDARTPLGELLAALAGRIASEAGDRGGGVESSQSATNQWAARSATGGSRSGQGGSGSSSGTTPSAQGTSGSQDPSSSTDPVGGSTSQALGTVGQVVSQLPLVGSVASNAVGAVGAAAGSATSAVSSAASSSAAASGVTSTVNGLLRCADGALVDNVAKCPVATGTSSVTAP